MLIAGVDGCRGGWLLVLWQVNRHSHAQLEILLCSTFKDVLAQTVSAIAIGVDIPIGLPEMAGLGGRPCDVAARSVLGERQSAVFSVPARKAVMQKNYLEACEVALNHSDPPRKVSKQCFNLFEKIREVDAEITPELQDRIIECHPEAAFWALNEYSPLPLAKKIRSRPNTPGLELRRRLLREKGFPTSHLNDHEIPKRFAGEDDVIDACACAWTALRFAQGEAHRFPDQPEIDDSGLRMEIWC